MNYFELFILRMIINTYMNITISLYLSVKFFRRRKNSIININSHLKPNNIK